MNEVNKNLKIILDKFKAEINPEQFDFSNFVCEFDKENSCGTICCIDGWFPKLFPNSGLYWKSGYLETLHPSEGIGETLRSLVDTSSESLIEYLFYGEINSILELYPEAPILGGNSPYEDVIKAWEYMIENWKEPELPNFSLS